MSTTCSAQAIWPISVGIQARMRRHIPAVLPSGSYCLSPAELLYSTTPPAPKVRWQAPSDSISHGSTVAENGAVKVLSLSNTTPLEGWGMREYGNLCYHVYANTGLTVSEGGTGEG